MKTILHDIHGRPYAKLSQLKVGDLVVVDDGFEGCFIPWSTLPVVEIDNELALIHNTPECGACGGDNTETACPHTLDGQLQTDNDTLIGIYKKKDFIP